MKLKLRAWKKHDTPEMFRDIAFIDFNKNLLGVNYKVSKLTTRLDIEALDKFILMQSTGLKDKNGTEIYEGDVIANQNKEPENWYISHHEVVWHDTGFMGKQICSSGSHIGLAHWTRGEDGYVVIGNIYENPELLKGYEK